LSAVRAIDDVVVLASRKQDVSSDWVNNVALELGSSRMKGTLSPAPLTYVRESHRTHELPVGGLRDRHLCDRVKNETTRLSAVRAIDDVVVLASRKQDVSSDWTGENDDVVNRTNRGQTSCLVLHPVDQNSQTIRSPPPLS
jgi:hypothetical protein